MNKRLLWIPLLAAGLLACGNAPSSSAPEASSAISVEQKDYKGNWTTDACYEIFVYSFCDSNGDGIGDLKGIESKLDYLYELGVRNLWLTPIHPSSTYHKYNVRDYYSVDPAFGSVDDFVSLSTKAKKKGMKVFMDMVFNHSGLDNPLFTQAIEDYLADKKGEDSLADLYSLSVDASEVPNTKRSYLYKGTEIIYECNFDGSMPEFNLKGQAAKKLHKKVMDYWIGKGADGFRFDGVAYFEFGDNEGSLEYVSTLSEMAKATKEDIYLVAEFWVNAQTYINLVPSHGMTCFNFPTSDTVTNSVIYAVNSARGYNFANTLAKADEAFYEASGGKILPSVFLSNHDQDRWAKNMTDRMIRQTAAMYLLTPGTPYLYYGEEIGMLGTRQVAATDANRRLPMQWKADASADTERATRVLRESDYSGKQTKLGALEAIQDPSSLTSWYKSVLNFRLAHPEIQKGYYQNIVADKYDSYTAFRIDYEGQVYFLYHNLDENSASFDLPCDVEAVGGFSLGEATLEGRKLTLGENSSLLLRAKL